MKRVIVTSVLWILPASVWGYFFFTGGPVFDLGKISELQLQYLADDNKLNLLNAQDQSAKDQFVAITAMDQVYGDGSHISAYVPGGVLNIDPQFQSQIQAYSSKLPSSPTGQAVADYLKRSQDRELILTAYTARLRDTAALQQKETLTLQELAGIQHSLESQGMETRLTEIQAQADSSGLKSAIRNYQNSMREYGQEREMLDKAMVK